MNKEVILLTDAHEAPTLTLVQTLNDNGYKTLIEGLREIEVALQSGYLHKHGSASKENGTPAAILFEVPPGADLLITRSAIEHALNTWPGVPLVACRRIQTTQEVYKPRAVEPSTLLRLGFHAVADDPAQLPALIRKLVEEGVSEDVPPTDPLLTGLQSDTRFYPRMRSSALRSAFKLVSSLHSAADQKTAADMALAGLSELVQADQWTIYLNVEAAVSEAPSLEPLAVRRPLESETSEADYWKRLLGGDVIAMIGCESAAVRRAASRSEPVKRTEKGRKVLAVPMLSSERVFGVLEVIRDQDPPKTFTKSEVSLLHALSIPIASAVSNAARIAEAERLSQTDDLTKLHNARYLRHFLLTEIKRSRRYGSYVSAVFLDLDDFKLINDKHGHLVGSHVLMEMASVIVSSVRDTDVIARYGGDEFVVVLPETALEPAMSVARRLRQKTALTEFDGGRRLKLRLTASFGVACFPQHAHSPQQLIASADSAMYDAKAAGKNCVRIAPEPSSLAESIEEKVYP